MIKTLIKKHWAILILAIFIGVLMVLPYFYFESRLGKDYKGIFPEIVNDEFFYYAEINDAVSGHFMAGNAYLWEHKNELPQSIFLTEYLLAQPIKLFNLDINTARLIYNFLLPIVSFLLAYAAFYIILKKRYWALAFSAFLFFGLYLFSFIRPVSPQFNFIFWLTQFIFLYLFISERKNKWFWLSIVNFGFLFYVYPYYWTYYLIFFGILAAFYFFKERDLSFKISKIAIGGLVLAIPYFYLNYLSFKLPEYAETLTRLGLINSRFPSGLRTVFWSMLCLAAFGWFLRKKIISLDAKTIFFVSGILAGVIAVNQHLITNKNIEFSSHYDMAAMFFTVFAVAYLRSFINKTKIFSAFIVIAVIMTISVGLNGYFKRILTVNEEGIYMQNYAPVLEWLNANAAKDSAVYANPVLSRLIPVYTADNVFYVRDANLFYISDSEVLDRFILNNFFENFDKKFVVENDRAIFGVRYVDAYGHVVQANKLRQLLGLKTEPEIYLPEEAIQKAISRARELQGGDFTEELKKYRVDYFVWDKNKNPNWHFDPKYFKKIFETDSMVVLKPLK